MLTTMFVHEIRSGALSGSLGPPRLLRSSGSSGLGFLRLSSSSLISRCQCCAYLTKRITYLFLLLLLFLLCFLFSLALFGRVCSRCWCRFSRLFLLTSNLFFLFDAFDTRIEARGCDVRKGLELRTKKANPRVKSTRLRRRAISSFFRLARSLLFFFSVYRLSSRLGR